MLLLLGVVGALIGYAGVLTVASEIDYRSIRDEAERQAEMADTRGDGEIREAMLVRVRELGLPRQAERLQVIRVPGRQIRIALSYADTISILNRWTWIRPRTVRIQQPY